MPLGAVDRLAYLLQVNMAMFVPEFQVASNGFEPEVAMYLSHRGISPDLRDFHMAVLMLNREVVSDVFDLERTVLTVYIERTFEMFDDRSSVDISYGRVEAMRRRLLMVVLRTGADGCAALD